MDTTVMNSQNSKTCKPHFLLLNITDKIDWQKRWEEGLIYQILVFTIHVKT